MSIPLQPRTFIQTSSYLYQIIMQIGEGQFGAVYLAINTNTQEQVAVKQVNKDHLKNPKVNELFQQERKIQASLKSENIVALKEVIDHAGTNSYLIVMEYCKDGDMQKYLDKHKYIPERQALAFFKQLLSAFKCMHQIKCMHRDIKVANIFLHNGLVKLGDFGFAKQLANDDITKTQLGTYATMAPEVFYREDYGFEADMYSLGVVFYQMLMGEYPFGINFINPHQLFKIAEKEEINFNKGDRQITQDTQDIIKKMLKFNRNERITWTDIYKHSAICEQENRFPPDVMHLSIIESDNVFNPKANSQFYEENEGLLKKEVFSEKENKYPVLIKEEIKVEFKKSIVVEQNQEILKKEKENEILLKKQTEMNKDFESGSKKYLHLRNLQGILIQMLNQILHFEEFKINYQIPAFFTIKKLLKMINYFVSVLEKHENIFQMKFFQEYTNNQQYQNFIKLGKADQSKVRQQYPILLNDCKSSIKRLRINDPSLNSHLVSEDCNNKFETGFKECLMNYIFGLREYYDKNLTELQKRKLFHHVMIMSDIANIDSFQKDNYDFNFEEYKTFLYNTPYNQFQPKLEEAVMKIFS